MTPRSFGIFPGSSCGPNLEAVVRSKSFCPAASDVGLPQPTFTFPAISLPLPIRSKAKRCLKGSISSSSRTLRRCQTECHCLRSRLATESNYCHHSNSGDWIHARRRTNRRTSQHKADRTVHPDLEGDRFWGPVSALYASLVRHRPPIGALGVLASVSNPSAIRDCWCFRALQTTRNALKHLLARMVRHSSSVSPPRFW